MIQEHTILEYRQFKIAISSLSSHGKVRGSFEQTWIHLSKDYLCQVWLKFAQCFYFRRRWKCEKLTDEQADGQTGDRKAHLSLQLRWAKNKCTGFIIWSLIIFLLVKLAFQVILLNDHIVKILMCMVRDKKWNMAIKIILK